MSTEKPNSKIGPSSTDARFVVLARMGEVIFHAHDAATIWGIANKNTLHTTLSRYIRAGLLFRLQNGLYSIKPLHELDSLLIGIKVLHSYCYVSTETVLSRAGIIQQQVPTITLISTISRQFTLATHHFRSRRLKEVYLFNERGVEHTGGVRIASPIRAIADLLYFNPRYHFDANTNIDWHAVNRMQREIGYPVTNRTHL